MIPKNKKIAILHPYMNNIWWAVKMMIFLWNFLQGKWNEVCFYTTYFDKELFKNFLQIEVKVLSKFKISYQIRKYDYIIIWNSPMQFVWVLSKILFLSKAKILWWHHHYPWYYSENKGFQIFLKKYLEKFSLKFIDLLIWNSFYIVESLKKIYKREVWILNPVVDKEFIFYKNKNLAFDSKTLITYWRWVKWKNVKQIFDTYEFLKNNFQNLKLLIWWEGEELKFYKEKYKGNKKIKFLWLVNKKSIIYNLEQSNVFLFPSKIDSFWISALESIFVWIPVIAFNEKWVVEIVQNWQNWYLVSDSLEFSLKVLEVLNDKNKNIELSRWCIKTRENFTYSRFEGQLENIFFKIRG